MGDATLSILSTIASMSRPLPHIPNTRLAICIPTRNRGRLLVKTLRDLTSVVEPYGVPIYVSDNHSDDDTRQVVRDAQLQYPYIHYSRCESLIEADDNFERVLKQPRSDYVWLFGDHYRILNSNAMALLIQWLDGEFDIVTLNAENRVRDVATQVFTVQNDVMTRIGWHMTMITSIIYKRSALMRFNFDRFRVTYFIQTLIAFEYMSQRSFKLLWIGDPIFGGYPDELPNSWRPRALAIFVRAWFVAIMSLPSDYSYASKTTLIRRHSVQTDLFSLKGIVGIRSMGGVTLRLLRDYRRELGYVCDRKQIVLLWMALLVPQGLLRQIRAIRHWVRT